MTIRIPEFITFTGLDARTDLARCGELSRRYSIEWGVLFSRSRQGNEPRYPDAATLTRIINDGPCRIAAHLCGAYAREIMAGESPSPRLPVDLMCFGRNQINHGQPDAMKVAQFVRGDCGARGIAQCRGDEFPAYSGIDWLFDRSGGEGKAPDIWPRHPGGGRLVGFAGGIGPGNVLNALNRIDSTDPYWIDMESGVRTDDWLDLAKVEAVCRAVYGEI